MSYYDGSKLLSHKRPYSVCVGIRSVGKTYWFTRFVIRVALRERAKSFVWMRRYQDDIDAIKTTFFDDMVVNNEFPDYKFTTRGSLMYATDKNGETFEIGEFIALSQAQRAKSSPRPTVKWLVFDEFMSENSKYLTNEIMSFYSVAYSIFRTERPVRVVLLSNAVSIVNPYFEEWGIKSISEEFTKSTNYVVENCDSKEFRKQARESSFGKSIGDSRYGDYAIDNKFLLDDLTNISELPKGETSTYCNFKLHGVLIEVLTVNGLWYFRKATNLQEKTYTIYVNDALDGSAVFLSKSDWDVVRYFAKEYASGHCLFDSVEVKNEIVLLARLVIKNF